MHAQAATLAGCCIFVKVRWLAISLIRQRMLYAWYTTTITYRIFRHASLLYLLLLDYGRKLKIPLLNSIPSLSPSLFCRFVWNSLYPQISDGINKHFLTKYQKGRNKRAIADLIDGSARVFASVYVLFENKYCGHKIEATAPPFWQANEGPL